MNALSAYLLGTPIDDPAVMPRSSAYPVHGLVPFRGSIIPIVARRVVNGTYSYTLHYRAADRTLEIHADVTPDTVREEIARYAKFNVEDQVYVDGRPLKFRVFSRRWSFRKGTVVYAIVDAKQILRKVHRTQEQLIAAEKLHEALDAPPEHWPQGYWDLDHVL